MFFVDIHLRCFFFQQMFSLTAILINVLVAGMGFSEEYDDLISDALILLNVVVIVIIAGKSRRTILKLSYFKLIAETLYHLPVLRSINFFLTGEIA